MENNKKLWTAPEVVEFGDVETLTLANNKNYGTGDGYTFQGATTRLSG